MKILLTGANGYIGRLLKRELLKDSDINLRLMVRNPKTQSMETRQMCEVVAGNTFDIESLKNALKGVDTAYYLIHSLASRNFKELDKTSAQNFLDAAVECGVKRIIYLGGLGVKADASEHLLSRIETGEILSSRPDKIQCIWFRAGVIIGSGSASFEIIRNLSQKLPIMITPKWVSTKAQPIGVYDVIRYLHDATDLEIRENIMIDIGSEAMRYGDMMLKTAKCMGLKRRIIPVPVLTPNLSSYWLMFFTPVPFKVAKSLIEGLSSEVTLQNNHARKYFDFEPVGFEEAVNIALHEIETNQVYSRWSNAGDGDVWEHDHQNDIANALFLDRKVMDISGIPKENVYVAFTSIGGENGWFKFDWLWEIRGFADKLFGGFGVNRGRRSHCDLRIGDCLDFWKVADLNENERLLLFAEMKVPGKAWLEFKIEGDQLIQSAYFYPKGLLGRIYWYMMVPTHYFIFKDMITQIVRKARG